MISDQRAGEFQVFIITTPTNCDADVSFTEVAYVTIAASPDGDQQSSITSAEHELPDFLIPGAFWVSDVQPVEVYAGSVETITLPEILCLLLDPCNWEVFLLDGTPDYVTLSE